MDVLNGIKNGESFSKGFQLPLPRSIGEVTMAGQFSSVQFSCSVVSDSLWPHESQHTRPPCPSPTSGVYPNSCPLSRCFHPTISSVLTFSSCPQFFPVSGSFQMSQLFESGGQSTGASASTSVIPMNTQDWSPLGWTSKVVIQGTISNNTILHL